MSSLSAPRWRSVAPEAIVWREWGGEFVVRNERSGSTHLLGALAGRVLLTLLKADGALTAADIAARLGDPQAAGAEAEADAAVALVLSEFHRLGLTAPERP